MVNLVPSFNSRNPSLSTVVALTYAEYQAAVTADTVTVAMLLALITAVIGKFTTAMPFLQISVPAAPGGAKAQNIIYYFNKYLLEPLNDQLGNASLQRYNTAFIARKDVLFNDNRNVSVGANAGTFSIRVPLSMIFNFYEQYTKDLYNFKHELQLNRTVSDIAIVKSLSCVNNAKLTLSMLKWYMPVITPNEAMKFRLISNIQNKEKVDLSFMNKTITQFTDLTGVTQYTAS